ncbi:hypothetical protein RRG08_005994 [Elysia crispata]|uniref:Uncharacterized protein n=1 Tax=Elysia crispata TaxID=231223 RepID=A0AAE0XUX4_9GAST|nr:hypothetical protein RRG08_005994 [Elysia crispata]
MVPGLLLNGQRHEVIICSAVVQTSVMSVKTSVMSVKVRSAQYGQGHKKTSVMSVKVRSAQYGQGHKKDDQLNLQAVSVLPNTARDGPGYGGSITYVY